MPLTGNASTTVAASDYSTVLSFDGDSFDANQVGYGTAVFANGVFSLYYAGLSFSNAKELGLAISTDAVSFVRYSNEPIVSNAQEPWFASFRLLPSTVMYENGIYKMWFFGIDSNLTSDPGQTTGWGYATSADGVNWSFNADPIRSETGAYQGDQLVEVVKLNGTYLAYYRDLNGPDYDTANKYYVASSADGVNFSGEVEYTSASGPQMETATAYGSTVISIWSDSGQYYTAYSTNGVDFFKLASIVFPANTGPTDLTVVGDSVIVWTGKSEGPGSWGGGTSSIGQFELSLDSFVGVTIIDNPVVIVGGNGNDSTTGGNNADDISGGNGNDTLLGLDGNDQLFGGNGLDQLVGGNGADQLFGGNGNDTLVAGRGNDMMTGGNGADRFIFNSGQSAEDADTIVDFQNSDRLVFSGYGIINSADFLMTQSGSSVLIAAHAEDTNGQTVIGSEFTILLLNTNVAQLTSGSFEFV